MPPRSVVVNLGATPADRGHAARTRRSISTGGVRHPPAGISQRVESCERRQGHPNPDEGKEVDIEVAMGNPHGAARAVSRAVGLAHVAAEQGELVHMRLRTGSTCCLSNGHITAISLDRTRWLEPNFASPMPPADRLPCRTRSDPFDAV